MFQPHYFTNANVEIYLDDEACPKNVAKIHVDEMD